MKNLLVAIVLFSLSSNLFGQSSIVGHLADEVSLLADGDSLQVYYSFEGCYGPYHHGAIHIVRDGAEIHSHSQSFTHKGEEHFTEANTVGKRHMVDALHEALEKESSEILGNAINFKILSGGQVLHEGRDRIGQRHFVELFHPFTSAFQPEKQPLIPAISSGGFVH